MLWRSLLLLSLAATAFAQPKLCFRFAVNGCDSNGFVISLQRDHAIRLPRLQIHQRLDDAATIRTAIDVIAEKNESRRAPIRMSLEEGRST